MEHAHTSSAKPYVLVLGALLALTAITVTAAGVNFGSPSVNVVIALAIASVKGSLVALYFMHLRHDKPINAVIFVAGLLFLAIFLSLCLIDFGAREQVRPSNWRPPAGSAAPCPAPAQSAAPAANCDKWNAVAEAGRSNQGCSDSSSAGLGQATLPSSTCSLSVPRASPAVG